MFSKALLEICKSACPVFWLCYMKAWNIFWKNKIFRRFVLIGLDVHAQLFCVIWDWLQHFLARIFLIIVSCILRDFRFVSVCLFQDFDSWFNTSSFDKELVERLHGVRKCFFMTMYHPQSLGHRWLAVASISEQQIRIALLFLQFEFDRKRI